MNFVHTLIILVWCDALCSFHERHVENQREDGPCNEIDCGTGCDKEEVAFIEAVRPLLLKEILTGFCGERYGWVGAIIPN